METGSNQPLWDAHSCSMLIKQANGQTVYLKLRELPEVDIHTTSGTQTAPTPQTIQKRYAKDFQSAKDSYLKAQSYGRSDEARVYLQEYQDIVRTILHEVTQKLLTGPEGGTTC